MISLDVQWVPVAERSGAYQWSGGDVSNRKVKTVTFFGTGEMRGQQQPKVITPPASDYTDAYLSAFASKPIPTRHVHRLSTSVFANAAPIPLKPISTPLPTNSSTKTSETRFVNINNTQTSSLFDKPMPSSSNRSSTYSSSFIPEKPTRYEPFSSTQYSSPQTQTFTSSYSTLLRTPTSPATSTPSPNIDSQRSYRTFSTRPESSFSTFPTVYRADSSYESIYKPIPPYSIQSYPPSTTDTTSLSSLSSTGAAYTSYVPYQSFPLSSSYDINQSSTSKRIVLPTSNVERQIGRPETLLFQHDEDVRSSRIEKPSPIISPSPESPISREELKIEPERLHMEELSTASEPIQILENTLNKYDSLINQISEVLASVSPLSSTVSSMSPGKSVLDYQFSSDSSPILQHKRIEPQSSQQSTTTTTKSSSTQRTKASHLIRGDSYDKIVTAISDLDSELYASPDNQNLSTVIPEEKEESKTTSPDESQIPSIMKEQNVKSQIPSLNDYRIPLENKQEEEETKAPSVPQEEIKTASVEEQHVSFITKEENEETKTSSIDEQLTSSIIKDGKEETKTLSLDDDQTPSVTEQEKKEEENKVESIEEHLATSTVEENAEETKTLPLDDDQTPSVTEQEKKEVEGKVESIEEHLTTSAVEGKAEETKTVSLDDDQTRPVTEQEESKVESIEEHLATSTVEENAEETKTVPLDDDQTPSVTEQEKKEEESKVESIEEHLAPSTVEEKAEETKTLPLDDDQTPSVAEQEMKEGESKVESIEEHLTTSAVDEKEEETKISSTYEHQTPSVVEEEKTEGTKTAVPDEHEASTINKEETKTFSLGADQTPSINEDEKKEESTTVWTDENQTAASAEEKKEEETEILSLDERQLPLVNEEEKLETKTPLSEQHPAPLATENQDEATKISSSEEHQTPSITEEEKKETKISLSDEYQVPSVIENEKKETETLAHDEQQVPAVSEKQQVPSTSLSDTSTSETESEEEKFVDVQSTAEPVSENAEFAKQQTDLSINVPVTVEPTLTYDEVVSSKKNGKRVTWDATVVDNEDDESSSYQSLSEESSTSETQTTSTFEDNVTTASTEKEHLTTDQSKSAVDQQLTSSDIIEQQITSDQTIDSSTSIEPSIELVSTTDQQATPTDSTEQQVSSSAITDEQAHQIEAPEQQFISSDTTDLQTDITQRETRSPSPVETSSTFLDSKNQQIASSNLTEPQSNLNEQQLRSTSPTDSQTVSVADSVKEDTFTVDEVSTTNSDAVSTEDISKYIEVVEPTRTESKDETTIDEHKVETGSQAVKNAPRESELLTAESTTISLQPTIVSPIDTLSDSVTNRYTSSDVYHGYLGEHKQFSQDTLDIDNDNTTKSFLTSLRETIATPITPLIETIQSVVSSMQTTTATQPLKNESEVSDHNSDETRLTTAIVTESKEEATDDKSQTEESKSTVETSEESKTVFENLREAITETIQTVVSNLQSDKPEDSSTSSTEQTTAILDGHVSAENAEPATNLEAEVVSSSNDTSKKEIEHTQSSLLDSIQEKVSKTITTIAETIQNVVSTNTPSTEEEQALQRETSDDQSVEHSATTVSVPFNEGIERISSDTTNVSAEKANEQIEKQETGSLESSSSEVLTPTSIFQNIEDKPIESIETTPITQHDKQVSAGSSVTSEHTNEQLENQKPTPAESSPADISPNLSIDQKAEDTKIEHAVCTSITQPDEQTLIPNDIPSEQINTSDKQETASSEILNIKTIDQKREDGTTGNISPAATNQYDEQVSSTIPIPSEQINIADKQETTTSEISSETTTDQKTDEDTLTETKTTLEVIRDVITHPFTTISEKIQSALSTSTSEQTMPETTEPSTSTPEATESPKEQQLSETESTVGNEQKANSTETTTTLGTILDIITHPITTISEKVQSVISTSTSEHAEQVLSDAAQPSINTSEQTESSEKQPRLELDFAVETENIESTETKTTFETLRDVITHPLSTITEKIQSVISSSTSEDVPSLEQQSSTTTNDQDKSEDITSTETKSIFETIRDTITHPLTAISETVQNVVSNTTDQSSSSGQLKSFQNDITTDTQATSTNRLHADQESPMVDTLANVQNNIFIQAKTISNTNEISSNQENKLLLATVHSLINDVIQTVIFQLKQNEEISSSDSGLTSPLTVLNVEDRSESSQSTINQEPITIDEDSLDTKISTTDINNLTWSDLVGRKSSDETIDHSFEEKEKLLEEVVQTSGELVDEKTTIILPNQTQSLSTTPQINDTMQRSTNELESDSTSAATEIENIPSKSREQSPTNTEDDPFELIRALQGHSIIHPSLTQTKTNEQSALTSLTEKTNEQLLQAPEKSSSSTTTSSQVTSSDRYVSYAIHEMGDSSQDRLPALPIAADIPIYESIKANSGENKEQEILSEPIVNVNQSVTKDDDLTELDATENLTSYSDDIILQKLNASAPYRQEKLDASSTDEDVDDENFNEFEQNDTSNLHRIVDEITHQSSSSGTGFGQAYQRYDLTTTSSSNNSSASTKPQTDDIYIIPGYPGLWRPSADDDSTHSPSANDADDEGQGNDNKKQSVKTRTIVRTANPTKLQSVLQQQQQQDTPIRPDTIDIFNRPLNEFSFDLSESDSFKTCVSTIDSSSVSKQQKQSELIEINQSEHQTSPEEKIFLIRERERGVSLPATVKIDYDDMALRLSTSTPIDTPLYSTTQTDLPSPTTYSEPIQKTTSDDSRASTPSLGSNENDHPQKPSSSAWLNTINTITTTTEGPDGPLEFRTTILKSAKGPISIAECDSQGKYIIVENTSRSKSIALASWKIRQESDNGDILTFKFPENCLLRPNQSLKVLTKPNESERRNSDVIASSLSSWYTGSNVVTTLINAEGKDRASLTKKTLFS